MTHPHEERRARVARALKELKVDALLVSNPANVRYLAGFTGSNGILLVMPDRAVFFTDPRYEIQASREVTCTCKVAKGPLYPAAAAFAAKKKIRRVGCEKEGISLESYQSIADKLKAVPVDGVVEHFRAVKSEEEIALIRRSVETNSQAFDQALREAKAGMSERDLAALIDYRSRLAGADQPAFDTIVAAGERSALPHARPGAARIESGLLLIDMGAMQDGYASDMTRTVHLGAAPKKVRDTYRTVLEAQLAAVAAVKPGVPAARVDRAARSVLATAGLDRAFVHSTGHGLGLQIHENPRIGKKSNVRLERGMAITIEPGVYLEGWGGIRIEDTVVVTETGCEVLTPTAKEFREI